MQWLNPDLSFIGRNIPISQGIMPIALPDGRWAVGRDTRGYIHDYKRAAADIYRVNTTTGERTLMMKAASLQGNPGITPNGKAYLYWKDSRFQAWDLDANTSRTLGGVPATGRGGDTGGPSFVNVEDDHPGPKPPYPIPSSTLGTSGANFSRLSRSTASTSDSRLPMRNTSCSARVIAV